MCSAESLVWSLAGGGSLPWHQCFLDLGCPLLWLLLSVWHCPLPWEVVAKYLGNEQVYCIQTHIATGANIWRERTPLMWMSITLTVRLYFFNCEAEEHGCFPVCAKESPSSNLSMVLHSSGLTGYLLYSRAPVLWNGWLGKIMKTERPLPSFASAYVQKVQF